MRIYHPAMPVVQPPPLGKSIKHEAAVEFAELAWQTLVYWLAEHNQNAIKLGPFDFTEVLHTGLSLSVEDWESLIKALRSE